MNAFRSSFISALLTAASLALAACNGTAVVTLTATQLQNSFLAYRIALTSVQLQTSGGKSSLKVLPAGTTADLAALGDVSEVLGAAAVAKGSYTSAVITVDFSNAQIVYDDGTVNGVALTAVGANGEPLGQVQLTATLDPSDAFSISSGKTARLALDFNLAASNVVNLEQKTVAVAPFIVASAMPIDAKQVRIRGPLAAVADASSAAAATAAEAAAGTFTMGVMPFNGTVLGAGELAVATTDATTYEINGTESVGTQIGGLSQGALTVAYGSFTTVDALTTTDVAPTTTADGITSTTGGTATTSTGIVFTATQVLAGNSVQGGGFDRVSGIVAARSGNTLTIEDGTLVDQEGTETFLPGTAVIEIGGNTVITVFGQDTTEINNPQEISVGSAIDAFGTATTPRSGDATLDASAGRVRLGIVTAAGIVTAQGSGTLNLNLASLGGRSMAAFDFTDSGAAPGQYVVNTGELDLTNSTAGAPVTVTGLPNSFGVAPPNFTALTLLDPTTIQAELLIDWGAGAAAPFTSFDSSAIDIDVHNGSIGAQHLIQVGAQAIDISALSSDPLIVPDPASSTTVFAIGHSASATVENFNTYASFIAQLQAELNGKVLATGMTAVGQYTASSFSFSATGITVLLNN